MNKAERLLFGTAGVPLSTNPRDTVNAMKRLRELGLDAMEIEYVRGTFPGEKKARLIASVAQEQNIRLTAHGPYYINLNANDPEKLENSRKRILNTAFFGGLSGAESITFHAGFFLKQDPVKVYRRISKELENLVVAIKKMDVDIDVRPELTGKGSQFGSLEEIINISKDVEGIKPCIDWAHLHARSGAFNTAAEFQTVLDTVRETLGEVALKGFHMHIAGIEYTDKGERKHLNLDESDFNYKELFRVLKDNGVCGFVICESPSLENDALILKNYYEKI